MTTRKRGGAKRRRSARRRAYHHLAGARSLWFIAPMMAFGFYVWHDRALDAAQSALRIPNVAPLAEGVYGAAPPPATELTNVAREKADALVDSTVKVGTVIGVGLTALSKILEAVAKMKGGDS